MKFAPQAMTPARLPPPPARRAELPGHIAAIAAWLFQSRGYPAVTMQQVAARAGVSKRTLYKYFPVKEALLEHMLESMLAQDLSQRSFSLLAQPDFRTGAMRLLRPSAQWCEAHAELLLPYIRYKFASFDPGAKAGADRGLLPVWTALIQAAVKRGEIRSRVPAAQLATYFHYLYLGALMRWLTRPGIRLRREFDTVVGLFMDGAAAGSATAPTAVRPTPRRGRARLASTPR